MSEVPLHSTLVAVPLGRGEEWSLGGVWDSCSIAQKTEMCSGSEEGSYLRLIDFCIAQLLA